jgi:hypothetical protein
MATETTAPSRMLRRTEAADYVQDRWGYPLSPRTLAKLACLGGGPKFRRASRFPLYEVKDLDQWIRGKLTRPVRSTSEYPEDCIARGYERRQLGAK